MFPLNNDFLSDLTDVDLNMETNWPNAYDYLSSPTSTGTESENDHDMTGLNMNINMLSPPQQLISSSQSDDSGLSSDHIDLYVFILCRLKHLFFVSLITHKMTICHFL